MPLTESKKIEDLMRHIGLVQQNCALLGRRLIDLGEIDLGRVLIANSLMHDQSKFFGIEWDHLWPGDPNLELAIKQHAETNAHHAEYWGNIRSVPRVYLAEMVCDWKSRSSEFGTSLVDWIHAKAMKKYGFTVDDEIYETIMYFVKIVCDPAFETIERK